MITVKTENGNTTKRERKTVHIDYDKEVIKVEYLETVEDAAGVVLHSDRKRYRLTGDKFAEWAPLLSGNVNPAIDAVLSHEDINGHLYPVIEPE